MRGHKDWQGLLSLIDNELLAEGKVTEQQRTVRADVNECVHRLDSQGNE
jgi:hypothetical protein